MRSARNLFVFGGLVVTACTGTLETGDFDLGGQTSGASLVVLAESEYARGLCTPLGLSVIGPEIDGSFRFTLQPTDTALNAAGVTASDEIFTLYPDDDCAIGEEIGEIELTEANGYAAQLFIKSRLTASAALSFQAVEQEQRTATTKLELNFGQGPVTAIEFASGPTTLSTGTCSTEPYLVQVKNAAGEVIRFDENFVIELLPASAEGTFHLSPACGDASITGVTIAAGSSQAAVYYRDPVAASPTQLGASSEVTEVATYVVHVSSLAPLTHTLTSDRPLMVTKQILDKTLTVDASYINDTNADGVSDPDLTYYFAAPNWDGNADSTVGGFNDVPTVVAHTTLTNLTGLYTLQTPPTVDQSFVKSAPDNAATLPAVRALATTFTANLNATATLPAAVDPATVECETVPAINDVDCSLSAIFPVTDADLKSLTMAQAQALKSQSGIRTRAFVSAGGEYDTLTSAPVAAQKLILKQVSNIIAGDEFPYRFTVFNDRVYFVAYGNNSNHAKLYSTNGTNLRQHTNLNLSASDGVTDLTAFNGRLYFTATSSSLRYLFSTNGTDLRRHARSSQTVPGGMNGRFYFRSVNAGNFEKLFSTNGTDLRQHTNTYATGSDFLSDEFIINNNRLFFFGSITSANRKVFSTNGLDLRQHTNLVAGGNDNPTELGVFGGRFYFRANSISTGRTRLYSTDGLDLRQHTNLVPAGNDFPQNLSYAGGRLYFEATPTITSSKLYSTNGEDLRQHTNLVAGGYDSPSAVIDYNGRYFFAANSSAGNSDLFSTNGSDLRQHSNFALSPMEFLLFNSRLYFKGSSSLGRARLFSTNGTDLRQETNIFPAGTENPGNLRVIGDKLFFRAATNASSHTKLYFTDGTHLYQVSDLVPGGKDANDYQGVQYARAAGLDFFSLYSASGIIKVFSLCDAAESFCHEN